MKLDHHMKSQFFCMFCKDPFSSQQLLDEHMKVHPQCDICFIRWSTGSCLKDHMMRSHLTCAICDLSFPDLHSLEAHNIKEEHWKCSQCGLVLQSKTSLSEHLKVHPVHLECSKCKLSFTDLPSLEAHNFKEKHWKCGLCYLIFKDDSSLMDHKKKAHLQCHM